MNLSRLIIFLAVVFFLFYGLVFSLFPAAMSLLVVDSVPRSISALIDMRATYGGMTIAIGMTLVYLYSIEQTHACLMIIIFVLMSMAATRTLGLFVDGEGNFFMYLYLTLEIAGSLLAWIAMSKPPMEKTDG